MMIDSMQNGKLEVFGMFLGPSLPLESLCGHILQGYFIDFTQNFIQILLGHRGQQYRF